MKKNSIREKELWLIKNIRTRTIWIILLIIMLHPILAHSQLHKRESVVLSNTYLYYGLQVKEGVGLFFSEEQKLEGFKLIGYQFKPFFSAFVEIGNLYSHDDVFNGIGIELQYAERGGKFTKYMNYPPSYLTLDYFDVRPCFVYHSEKLGFVRIGVDYSYLLKSNYTDARNGTWDGGDLVNKRDLGIWIEAGGTIKEHFTISFFLDWLFWGLGRENNDLLMDDYWGIPTDDHSISVGITIGWLFNPIKIKTNKF